MNERSLVKNFIMTVLLAALCVCAAELAACRSQDPALYERIVTPVRILYHGARTQVKDISGQYAQWLSDQADLREELAQAQRLRAEELRIERERQRQERLRVREEKRRAREEERARKAEERRLKKLMKSGQLPEDTAPQDTTPAAVTELVHSGSFELLTGGNRKYFVYYNQKDDAWADKLFGRDPIGTHGCGPVVVAMLVSTFRGKALTPEAAAQWASNAGYAAPSSGSYLSIIQGAADHYGFSCQSPAQLDGQTLYDTVKGGAYAVALMGRGHFTKSGHFIIIHGTTEDGGVLVADPNSRENSVEVWDPELIISELSASRYDGAPLWIISP